MGEAIGHGVIECLKDHNVDISKAKSYDGAQCMFSDKVGVQARISTRALYIYTAAAMSSI